MASFDDSSDASHWQNNKTLDPHALTLGSVADSFRSEDYQPPPPGVDPQDWARLGRSQGADGGDVSEQSGTTGGAGESSLLDEEMPNHSSRSGGSEGLYDDPVHPTTTKRSSHLRPDSSLSTRTSTSASNSRYPSHSTAATSLPSSHQTFNSSTQNDTQEDISTSTEVDDRTELLSERLAGAGEEPSLDETRSSIAEYGFGVLAGGGKPSKKRESRSSGGVGQNMTLREQEKVIDELKKDNFSLKLKLHFYEQRLEKMAPSSVEQALRENIQLKVEFQTLRTELKRYKKLLLEGDKAIQNLTNERDELMRKGSGGSGRSAREKEMERELKRLRERDAEREGWERKARELHKEVKQLRANGGAEDVEDLRAQLEDVLSESDELQHRLRDATDELDELRDEVASLRRDLADQADQSIGAGDRSRGTIRREVEKLEQENASLRSQVSAQLTMLSTRNDEKDALREQVEHLKQDLVALENELDVATRAQTKRDREGPGDHGGKSREELEEELNAYRDRATSLSLELEDVKTKLDEKEREIEELLADWDEKDEVHKEEIRRVDEEWREEVEGARAGEREAKEILEDREADVQDLADRVETLMRQLAEKEAEMAADAEEVEALTHDLQKLGAQIFALEEEGDEKDKQMDDLRNELAAVDKELEDKQAVHDQVVLALKDKLASAKSRLSEVTIQHESATTESKFLREKVEDLALVTAKLEEQARADAEEKRKLQDEADEIMRALRKEEEERDADAQEWQRERDELERTWKREIDELEAASLALFPLARLWHRMLIQYRSQDLRSSQNDVKQLHALLATRESDIQSLQDTLNGLETASRRQGESATSDRFALELEMGRAKRDLARAQKELEQIKEELDERVRAAKEKELQLATLVRFSFPRPFRRIKFLTSCGRSQQSENRDLATQLASQTQSRLALAEKHDMTSKTLRDTLLELTSARDRLRVVEGQLSTDHRELSRTENQYRDQLTERNTLLLTVYQYMERIAGPEKVCRAIPRHSLQRLRLADPSTVPQRKAGEHSSPPKPFNNFTIFHDRLIERLKGISTLQMSFERRAKELEGKFVAEVESLKKQQERRNKQIDGFEASIRTASETQRQWRVRVHQKQVELDAAKGTVSELQSQLQQLRRSSSAASSPNSSRSPNPAAEAALQSRLSVAQSRAQTLERRLAATQAQLNDAEDKLGEQRMKIGVAEGKWEARFRELEGRCRAAEEKVKRERQGAKERVGELMGTIKTLEGQVSGARKRDQLLDEVIKQQKADDARPPSS
ncbi:SPOSA6832_02713 [Sporobolomyces salmonicolor]|uniref:SPOSA6832_02713-mRNA-1:cds n=1 Tax=Sporidiobolus salmonicolor TaxID=5005 RepID=A0A0D6ELZ9_SPOSA|nr:SPOSA6832_02713 [Sporobolomyces salmonicolor]